MKRTSPYFLLPADFHAEDLFPRSPAMVEEARYLVDLIFRKTRHRDVDQLGYARLNATLLRGVIDGRHLGVITRKLTEAGVIEVDGSYETGRKSKGFRLTEPYLEGEIVRRPIVHPVVRDRVERAWEFVRKQQRARRKPIHEALERAQLGLSFAFDPRATIAKSPPAAHACQRALVRNIQDRDPSFHVGGTGRVFNGITGLAKSLRKLVLLDGEPLGYVDLTCAQFALLGLLAEAAYAGCPIDTNIPTEVMLQGLRRRRLDRVRIPPDVRAFVECTAEGLFYEALLAKILENNPPISTRLASRRPWTRERVKKLAISQILAPKSSRQTGEVSKAFEQLFPSVAAYIADFNRDDHGTLIRALQRVEAALVVHSVAPALIDRIPIVTLHDAIYCRAGDVKLVREAFEDVFSECGIRMSVKVESAARPTASALAGTTTRGEILTTTAA